MTDYPASSASDAPGNAVTTDASRLGGIVGGLAVIGIGLAFLAENLGFDWPFSRWHNGWASFILLGAVPSLGRAFDRYRSVGTVDAFVLRCLIRALMVITVAVILLLDASFAVWWPLFVILGGLSMLAGGGRAYRRDWARGR